MSTARKLRINGREVPVLGNQMIFDLSDIDLGAMVEDEPKPRAKLKCDCGARAVGCQDYMAGHATDCPVHEDKTPIM